MYLPRPVASYAVPSQVTDGFEDGRAFHQLLPRLLSAVLGTESASYVRDGTLSVSSNRPVV